MPTEMKQCVLNGTAMRSLDDLYDELSRQLSLPKHFGRNLDALWDTLAIEMEGPFEILWRNAKASERAMGKDFARVVKILHELEEEREDFKLVLVPT